MPIDLQALRNELNAGHPTSGPYHPNNATAADEINNLDRPAPGGIDRMMKYMLENRNRTNQGTDTAVTSLLGRLVSVSNATPGSDPFGSGNTVTMEQIHAARMFLEALRSPHLTQIDFVNTEISQMLDTLGSGPGTARVMKAADVTALKALSANRISRATELGFPRLTEIDIADARAL